MREFEIEQDDSFIFVTNIILWAIIYLMWYNIYVRKRWIVILKRNSGNIDLG